MSTAEPSTSAAAAGGSTVKDARMHPQRTQPPGGSAGAVGTAVAGAATDTEQRQHRYHPAAEEEEGATAADEVEIDRELALQKRRFVTDAAAEGLARQARLQQLYDRESQLQHRLECFKASHDVSVVRRDEGGTTAARAVAAPLHGRQLSMEERGMPPPSAASSTTSASALTREGEARPLLGGRAGEQIAAAPVATTGLLKRIASSRTGQVLTAAFVVVNVIAVLMAAFGTLGPAQLSHRPHPSTTGPAGRVVQASAFAGAHGGGTRSLLSPLASSSSSQQYKDRPPHEMRMVGVHTSKPASAQHPSLAQMIRMGDQRSTAVPPSVAQEVERAVAAIEEATQVEAGDQLSARDTVSTLSSEEAARANLGDFDAVPGQPIAPSDAPSSPPASVTAEGPPQIGAYAGLGEPVAQVVRTFSDTAKHFIGTRAARIGQALVSAMQLLPAGPVISQSVSDASGRVRRLLMTGGRSTTGTGGGGWIGTTRRRPTDGGQTTIQGMDAGGSGSDNLVAARTKYAGEALVMADEFDAGLPTSSAAAPAPSTSTGVSPPTVSSPASTGTGLDTGFWKHEISMSGFGNWEFEIYSNNRSNSYVRDSVLYLRPTLTASAIGEAAMKGSPPVGPYTHDISGTDPATQCTGPMWDGCRRTSDASAGLVINPITSARLRTAESFAFRYGRLEVKARLPRGDWIWPAIWLLPRSQAYGPWPASGEIDVMESRGNGPGYVSGGRDKFGSTLHWGPTWDRNMWHLTTSQYTDPQGDLSATFHVYGCVWSPTRLYTYIDVDDAAHRVLDVDFAASSSMWSKGGFDASGLDNVWASGSSNAPFDQEFYLIMNVAVGGGNDAYFPVTPDRPWGSGAAAMGQFWDNTDKWLPSWTDPATGSTEQAAMAIDYVRVWQRQGSGGKLNPDSSISAAADQSSVWPSQWGMAKGQYPAMPMPLSGGGRRMTGSGGQPRGAGVGGWFSGNSTAGAPATPAAAAGPGVCAVQVNVSASLTGDCAGIHVVTGDDGSGSDVDGPDVQAAANKAAAASAAVGSGGGADTNIPQYNADFKPGAAGSASSASSSSGAYAGTATPTPSGRRAAAEAAEASGEAQHAHQQLHVEKQEESKPGRHGRQMRANVIHAHP